VIVQSRKGINAAKCGGRNAEKFRKPDDFAKNVIKTETCDENCDL